MLQENKENIMALSEDEMLLIVQEYVNAIGDTLKKTVKQISTKCYEVTLALSNKKTIGFGRNQKDASINALKKLLDYLASNDIGSKIMNDALSGTNQNDVKVEVKVIDLSKFNQKTKNPFTNPPIKTKLNLDLLQKPFQVQNKIISNQKHSLDSLYQKDKPSNSTDQSSQLSEAKAYILKLQAQVFKLRQQNRRLKGNQSQQKPRRFSRQRVLSQINLNQFDNHQSKKIIPKLNLLSLPNYHGKSRKSLNQSMLLKKK